MREFYRQNGVKLKLVREFSYGGSNVELPLDKLLGLRQIKLLFDLV